LQKLDSHKHTRISHI